MKYQNARENEGLDITINNDKIYYGATLHKDYKLTEDAYKTLNLK